MSVSVGFTILVCLLVACLHTEVLGAPGDLDDACNGSGTCTDATNHVCDINLSPSKCRIKDNADCANKVDKCVDGAVCETTTHLCLCSTGRPAVASGMCTVSATPPPSGTAAATVPTVPITTPAPSVAGPTTTPAPLKLGDNCTSAKCPADLLCDSNVCKSKKGGTCSSDVQCQTGTTCNTSNTTCLITNKRAEGPCNESDNKACDDTNAKCTSSLCKCIDGFTLNEDNYTCKKKSGAVTAMASLLVTLTAFLASRLV